MPLYYPPGGLREAGRSQGFVDILEARRKRKLEEEASRRGEEKFGLEKALTEAKTDWYGRRGVAKEQTPEKIIGSIAKLQKAKENAPPVFGSMIDKQLSELYNQLAEAEGGRITETPAEKQFGGPEWLPNFLRDILARDKPAETGFVPNEPPSGPQLGDALSYDIRTRQPDSYLGEMGRVPIKKPTKTVPSKVTKAKTTKAARPPKPTGYPDAVWNEEHGMWTVVRNGRLKGIK